MHLWSSPNANCPNRQPSPTERIAISLFFSDTHSTAGFLWSLGICLALFIFLKPMWCIQANLDQHQHHRHLDQYADHCSQSSAWRQTKKHGWRCNGYFEMIGCPDHGWWCGIYVAEFQKPRQTISKPKNKHGLDKQRNRDPHDGQWITDNHLTFKWKQQHQSYEQCDNCNGGKDVQKFSLNQVTPLAEIIHLRER